MSGFLKHRALIIRSLIYMPISQDQAQFKQNPITYSLAALDSSGGSFKNKIKTKTPTDSWAPASELLTQSWGIRTKESVVFSF